MSLADLAANVRVVEVGLRDGLQSVERTLRTEDKLELVDLLLAAGVREIEVASFAHPKVLPQLADAADVLAGVPRDRGVTYRALVPNLRGAERALEAGADEVVALACCDDRVSLINQGADTDAVLTEIERIGELCANADTPLSAGIAMSFFAPGTGRVEPKRRDAVVRRCIEAGASSVYLADSVGMADPLQVGAALERHRTHHPDIPVGLHLHARNGFALANVLVALNHRVDWLECAFGGLGGDLWFPGDPEVLGNLATEDLLEFTAALGVDTGVDRAAYRAVGQRAAEITGRRPVDHRTRGGSREELMEIDWDALLTSYGRPTTAREDIS